MRPWCIIPYFLLVASLLFPGAVLRLTVITVDAFLDQDRFYGSISENSSRGAETIDNGNGNLRCERILSVALLSQSLCDSRRLTYPFSSRNLECLCRLF